MREVVESQSEAVAVGTAIDARYREKRRVAQDGRMRRAPITLYSSPNFTTQDTASPRCKIAPANAEHYAPSTFMRRRCRRPTSCSRNRRVRQRKATRPGQRRNEKAACEMRMVCRCDETLLRSSWDRIKGRRQGLRNTCEFASTLTRSRAKEGMRRA